MSLYDELDELSKDIAVRKRAVVAKWKATLPPTVVRAECNTPEMIALRQEEKRRFGEILEKYKNEKD